jgi:hypothetical protein
MVVGVEPAGEGAARDPGLDRTHRGADAPRGGGRVGGGGLLSAGRRRREGAVRHTELADLRTAINTMDPISDRSESTRNTSGGQAAPVTPLSFGCESFLPVVSWAGNEL